MVTLQSGSGTAGRRGTHLAGAAGGALAVVVAAWLVTSATREAVPGGAWDGSYTDVRGLAGWLVVSVSEPQFYATAAASVCLLLGGLLAHVAHRRAWSWEGFVQACGTGIWPPVAGAGLASLALGNLAWGWTLAPGDWQPLFVPLVSVAPAIVVLYGPGWRVVGTATILGALLTPPAAVLLVERVCLPLDLPPVVGATGGMAVGAVGAFWLCRHLPWLPTPGAWRVGRQASAGSGDPTSSLLWIPRRALADFSEAQFYGNEWASAALLAGAVAAYVANPASVVYGTGLFVAVLGGQVLTALAGAVLWRRRWRALGFYPTFVPVVSVAPAAVLTYDGTPAAVVLGALAGALVAPPVAAGVSARLPADFHPFTGNVVSMSVCTAVIVPLLVVVPGVSSMSPTTTAPSISDLAGALRRRETSATELAMAALRRIVELNPSLNAFALVDEAGALAAARAADIERAAGIDRGSLHGVPVAVKDLIDIAGLPTTCGSASTFGTRAAADDAEVVARLRRAGAVIVGKTTLHELAYGATGDRSVHGPSRNPRDSDRMSGGSSGGSAVAVAAGMVPLTVGTDTVGSVRVPAALCGVVGFKPAFEDIPGRGVHPLAPSLDHVGLFAATTADVVTAYDVLGDGTAGAEPSGPLTVGWIPPQDIAVTDPRIEAAVHELLTRAGLDLRVVRDLATNSHVFGSEIVSILQGREAYHVHEHHLEQDHATIDPEVLARLRRGGEVTAADYARADRARRRVRDRVGALLETHRVLALPTTPVVAPLVGQRSVRIAETDVEVRSALLSLTSPWNLAGVPAISVPAGDLDGLPIAVQLVTAAGREPEMFALARTLEATLQSTTSR